MGSRGLSLRYWAQVPHDKHISLIAACIPGQFIDLFIYLFKDLYKVVPVQKQLDISPLLGFSTIRVLVVCYYPHPDGSCVSFVTRDGSYTKVSSLKSVISSGTSFLSKALPLRIIPLKTARSGSFEVSSLTRHIVSSVTRFGVIFICASSKQNTSHSFGLVECASSFMAARDRVSAIKSSLPFL